MAAQNSVSILKRDHKTVKQLFKRLDQEKADKWNLFEQIKSALEVHATLEEEIFYPALKQARAEHVTEEVLEAYEEHKQIKTLLGEIAESRTGNERFDAKLKVLKEDVEHHVEEEEGQMFPDAKKFLGDTRLTALGAELETRKRELEKMGGAKSQQETRSD